MSYVKTHYPETPITYNVAYDVNVKELELVEEHNNPLKLWIIYNKNNNVYDFRIEVIDLGTDFKGKKVKVYENLILQIRSEMNIPDTITSRQIAEMWGKLLHAHFCYHFKEDMEIYPHDVITK